MTTGQINPYEDEKRYLEVDRERYMECMNNKPLSERTTDQDVRDGLILHFHVYRFITKRERINKDENQRKPNLS